MCSFLYTNYTLIKLEGKKSILSGAAIPNRKQCTVKKNETFFFSNGNSSNNKVYLKIYSKTLINMFSNDNTLFIYSPWSQNLFNN